MTRKAIVLLAVLFLASAYSHALPRFSLMYGVSCSNCHFSPNGGGPRTEGGWNGIKSSGLINPSNTFLAPLYRPESNTLFTEELRWGFDIRNQIAKRGRLNRSTLQPEFYRSSFFMQIAPYLTYQPADNVSVSGALNIVEPEYPEQQHFLASVAYKPVEMVTLQGGFFLPDIGLNHDDHTFLTRELIGMRRYYQELGADVHVRPFDWLMGSLGVFQSKNRHDVMPQVKEDGIMTSIKLQVQPVDYDLGVSVLAGGSALLQMGQNMFGAHAGIGWIDRASLHGEYIRYENDPAEGTSFRPSADIYNVMASFQVLEGLALTARYEEGKIHTAQGRSSTVKQYVIGAEIFILPFVELRPEYRWKDTDAYRLAQYAIQTHIFY